MPDAMFLKLCAAKGLPVPIPEYRFAPPRRWRFDYAWRDALLALEVDGGIWVQGRHSRGSGLLKEHEKFNRAACLGWRVVRVTPATLCSPSTFALLRAALGTPR